jgi:hypothetical protein
MNHHVAFVDQFVDGELIEDGGLDEAEGGVGAHRVEIAPASG